MFSYCIVFDFFSCESYYLIESAMLDVSIFVCTILYWKIVLVANANIADIIFVEIFIAVLVKIADTAFVETDPVLLVQNFDISFTMLS